MRIRLFRQTAFVLWPSLLTALLTATASVAQNDPLILDDSVDFAADFEFDDALTGEFDEQTENSTPSWLEHFILRISQQLSGQINSHSVPLAPGFTLPCAAEIETNRFGIDARYQNPFAPGWLLQASGHARVYWKEDYEYRANDDRIDTEFRINEFFVQRSGGQHSVKLGRQTVVWGETVGNSVLDIINTSEFRDLTIIDIEDARLNQWLLVWD